MQFLIQDFQTHISLGVYPIEKRIRNKVLITISFYYDTVNAEVSDQLKDTIDYDLIISAINEIGNKKHYNLIEHFISKLSNKIIMLDSKITHLEISLKKLNAISKADFVELKYKAE
jgi:dihydroneopterin aldolase